MEHRLLVIDADETHQQVLRKVLDSACLVVSARTLAEAEIELGKSSFDLILLDVTLPDGDGFSFFTKLKAQEPEGQIPVIFTTSRNDVAQELMGFSLGAEDYLIKPLDPQRLKARIEARLSLLRDHQQREMVLTKGNVRLNVNLQQASIAHQGREMVISLSPVEFKLLFHFLRFEDRVFSREQLLVSVWDNAAEAFDRTVDLVISQLNKKIALSDFEVKQVHGLGYKLSRQKFSRQKFSKGG